jgi:class 3 adenylate cyclase/Tfp pilus assembly protein PilF
MAAEIKKEIQLEIAHVLFTDIVGYSKLPIHQQRALVERLSEIVRGTDEYQAAKAAGRLITIPTGDGITLVFYDSPETPAECALEISRALKNYPEVQLRMGIHSGPVSGVIDATGKANVAGAGINIAQRVMDCGDAGHILLSKHVAEDLEEYPHWQPHLHELGECEVKHGVRVSVVNLYTPELGNPAVPEMLNAARAAAITLRRWAALRRLSLGSLAFLALLAVIGFLFFRYKRPLNALELAVPEKSIAVLPFENRSEDKANAYFAEGIQDEILTRLSKISHLRVISRTSTQHYKSAPENLPEIAKQAWLDPNFALSWALLSIADARGYITQSLQPTVALREETRHAAETALALQPNLGEALLAMGNYYYACLKDYDTAGRYFEQARQLLPNSSQIPALLASVARRRGQWERSESYFNQTEWLDPRNVNLLGQHAQLYIELRRFPEALRKFDQILDIMPGDVDTIAAKAGIAQAQGDLPRASVLLASIHPPADDPQALEAQVYQVILERRARQIIPRLMEVLEKPDPALGSIIGELRFYLGWAQEIAGDHSAAQESWRQAHIELEFFLKEQPENFSLMGDLALTSMGLGDKAAAFKLIESAMAVIPIEKDAVAGPIPIEILARVSARMGEPDRAIAALEKLLSIPYDGALAQNVPLTPALLRLDPMFDPLRNDARFQKLAAGAPKTGDK